MKERKNMKDLNAIDKQNLDGAYGATAVAMDWPEDLSEKAKEALGYLDDTAYLFHYLGKYIITDESLWLTEFGNGTMDSPYGFPRAEFSSLEEVGPWLESVADELEDF